MKITKILELSYLYEVISIYAEIILNVFVEYVECICEHMENMSKESRHILLIH